MIADLISNSSGWIAAVATAILALVGLYFKAKHDGRTEGRIEAKEEIANQRQTIEDRYREIDNTPVTPPDAYDALRDRLRKARGKDRR